MQHRWGFELVDRFLCDVMGTTKPFGGKVVVFGGDFRQILPIIIRGSQGQTENACLKFSYIWPSVETLKLTTNMRVARDPQFKWFVDFLLCTGGGKQPTVSDDVHSDYVEIPEQALLQAQVQILDPGYFKEDPLHIQFIKAICPGIDSDRRTRFLDPGDDFDTPQRERESTECTGYRHALAMLSPCSRHALAGKANTYHGQASVSDTEYGGNYPIEYLPPFKLTLKTDHPVILRRNMDARGGL